MDNSQRKSRDITGSVGLEMVKILLAIDDIEVNLLGSSPSTLSALTALWFDAGQEHVIGADGVDTELGILQALLTAGADVNAKAWGAPAIFFCATGTLNADVVEKLLQADGIKVNACSGSGNTALRWINANKLRDGYTHEAVLKAKIVALLEGAGASEQCATD